MIFQKLSEAITPITAQPFQHGYREYSPCKALKPYIRCFWTSANQSERLVIPDLCADIIFDTGSGGGFFCGASDQAFVSQRGAEAFGIRFYLWTAALYAEDSIRTSLNGCFDLDCHFARLKKELAPKIAYAESTEQRISLSEDFLARNLKQRQCQAYTEALGKIIDLNGVCTARDLSQELHISVRQLERIFAEYSGLSPKKTAMLIRYQLIWRDVLAERNLNILDKVAKYGYTDQAHLLNDFRKFHMLTPKQARETALKDVAFLQDNRFLK